MMRPVLRRCSVLVLASCATMAPSTPPPAPPAWVAAGSGVHGERRQHVDGVGRDPAAVNPRQAAYDRASASLDTQLAERLAPIRATLTGPSAETFDKLIAAMRPRVTPTEFAATDGTWSTLMRFDMEEVVLAIGSAERMSPEVKQALLTSVVGALTEPAWVARGSVTHGGQTYGVGKTETLDSKNWSLAVSTADNRARAELAKLLGDGATEVRMQGATIEHRWLGADGTLYALARLVQ